MQDVGGPLSIRCACGLRDALTIPNCPIKCSVETQPGLGPTLLSQPIWLSGASLKGPGLGWEVVAMGQARRALMGRLMGRPEGVGSWPEAMEGRDFGEFPGSGVLPSRHFHFN